MRGSVLRNEGEIRKLYFFYSLTGREDQPADKLGDSTCPALT